MMWQLAALACGGGLVGVALWLASKNGSKAAQLEALKLELKKQTEEQQRVTKIRDGVMRMDESAVRERLHEIANRVRRRV